MPRYRYGLIAVALLVLGTATPPSTLAQAATDDPAQQAADAARQAAVMSAPHFDPATRTCQNEPTERDGGRWVTVAPRETAHPASFVMLMLGGGNWNEAVTVTVTAPDGDQLTVTEPVTQDGRLGTMYPIRPALPGPESRVPGVYTVVWTTAALGTYLACDGFVVER